VQRALFKDMDFGMFFSIQTVSVITIYCLFILDYFGVSTIHSSNQLLAAMCYCFCDHVVKLIVPM
jgi:hypothetical protein